MFTTIADLMLKAFQALSGERARIQALERDERDRIADFLENISKDLSNAAERFANNEIPWREIGAVTFGAERMLETLGYRFSDIDFALKLRRELSFAVSEDRRLITITEAHETLDSLRQTGRGVRSSFDKIRLKTMSKRRAEQCIAEAIRKLEESSGLFLAAARELRATTDRKNSSG